METTGKDGTSTGMPSWLRSAIAVVVLSLVGFFVAGRVGGFVGASAATNDLQVGNRIVAGIRPHLDAVLQQAREGLPYANPENWTGSRPSADTQFRHYTVEQIRDYAYREVYEIASGRQRGLAGGDPYREAAFILGCWDRTHK